jgi:hypothetical protein
MRIDILVQYYKQRSSESFPHVAELPLFDSSAWVVDRLREGLRRPHYDCTYRNDCTEKQVGSLTQGDVDAWININIFQYAIRQMDGRTGCRMCQF